MWGEGTRATVRAMQDRYGKEDLSVICIGQAGENLVRYAGFMNEHDRAAGRGGTGAVAGFKKLKAIVIKAAQKGNMPQPAQDEEYKKANQEALKAIMEGGLTAPKKGGLSVYGTNVLTSIINEIEDEIKNMIQLIDKIYKVFGFEYSVALSTRPEDCAHLHTM